MEKKNLGVGLIIGWSKPKLKDRKLQLRSINRLIDGPLINRGLLYFIADPQI